MDSDPSRLPPYDPATLPRPDSNSPEPWNEPDQEPSSLAHRRAAKWLWVVASLEILATTCCVGMLTQLSATPIETIEDSLVERGANEAMLDMVRQTHPHASSLAISYGLMGLIPGVVLAGLGFAVARRNRPAVVVCMVIVLMQALLCGAFVLMGIAQALATGQPQQFTFVILMLGSVLLLLVFTFRHLLAARRAEAMS